MQRKTITIDLDAHERLSRARRENETFSQTIKRLIPAPLDLDAWLKQLESDPVNQEFVAAVERQIASRGAKRRMR